MRLHGSVRVRSRICETAKGLAEVETSRLSEFNSRQDESIGGGGLVWGRSAAGETADKHQPHVLARRKYQRAIPEIGHSQWSSCSATVQFATKGRRTIALTEGALGVGVAWLAKNLGRCPCREAGSFCLWQLPPVQMSSN